MASLSCRLKWILLLHSLWRAWPPSPNTLLPFSPSMTRGSQNLWLEFLPQVSLTMVRKVSRSNWVETRSCRASSRVILKRLRFRYLFMGCIRSWLRHAGSSVAAHAASVASCRVWFPDQGLNPAPLYAERRVSLLGHEGSPKSLHFNFYLFYNMMSRMPTG